MTLDELRPLCRVEQEMVKRLNNEDEAVIAILNRRAYLKESDSYIGSLCEEQFKGRFQFRNEKETATMPILYEEDK